MAEEKLNFYVEPRLLDHISISMYSNLNKAVGELIANCYDADSEIVKFTLPEKIRVDSKIIIEDDGSGMDLENIKNHFLHIGGDNRPTDSSSPKFKRLIIGSKGIGKFAGLGICKNMQIITIKNNTEYKFEIDRTIFDLKETSLENTPIPYKTKATDQSNGTKVILYNFREHIKKIDIEDLRFFIVTQFGFFENFFSFLFLVCREVRTSFVGGVLFELLPFYQSLVLGKFSSLKYFFIINFDNIDMKKV